MTYQYQTALQDIQARATDQIRLQYFTALIKQGFRDLHRVRNCSLSELLEITARPGNPLHPANQQEAHAK